MSDKKKNSISLGLREGNPEEGHVNTEAYLARVEAGKTPEQVLKPALIHNSCDYPITVKYGQDSIRLSGRSREKVADFDKLENPLPKGVVAKVL